MVDFFEAFRTAVRLILDLDADLVEIVLLSLRVSLTALVPAVLIGMPLGAFVAIRAFPLRRVVVVFMSALMALPPVVVGLAVYVVLSRAGPLGNLGLLFTPTAMVIAQAILIAPIIASLTRQTVADLWEEYEEQLRSLGASRLGAIPTLLWEGRYRLVTTTLAGLGRAIAEVGAVIIVGGNIAHATRVMTTAIALETSKGDLVLAMGLGLVLIALSLFINAVAFWIQDLAQRVEA